MTISSNDKTVIKSISPFQTLGNTIIWTQVRQKSVSSKDWENVCGSIQDNLLEGEKYSNLHLSKRYQKVEKLPIPHIKRNQY